MRVFEMILWKVFDSVSLRWRNERGSWWREHRVICDLRHSLGKYISSLTNCGAHNFLLISKALFAVTSWYQIRKSEYGIIRMRMFWRWFFSHKLPTLWQTWMIALFSKLKCTANMNARRPMNVAALLASVYWKQMYLRHSDTNFQGKTLLARCQF